MKITQNIRKSFQFTFLLFVCTTAIVAQNKKDIVHTPYSSEAGRIISSIIYKTYTSYDPNYYKLVTPIENSQNFIDKNDIVYIMKLQNKNSIQDESLMEIIKNNPKLNEEYNRINKVQNPEMPTSVPAAVQTE